MDFEKRLRNKVFITTLISFLLLCIKTFTKYELPSNIDTLVNLVLTLGSMLGIFIDPTTEGIKDGVK